MAAYLDRKTHEKIFADTMLCIYKVKQLNSHNLMIVCLGIMKLGLHQESERSQTKKRSFRWINSKVSDASHKWALTSSALQLLLKSWMLILNAARVSNNEVSAFWLTSEPGASGSFKHSFSDRFSTLGSVRSHPRLTSQAVSTETPPACCLVCERQPNWPDAGELKLLVSDRR